MKGHRQIVAFATAMLAFPLFAVGQQSPMAGQQEARLMKPVRATLVHTLDAAKDQQGYAVQAKLDQKVTLSNGTELPRNTILIGKITQDDMQQQGLSKLALRFDQAELQDGKMVPVRATIVGYYTPGTISTDMGGDMGQVPNDWTARTLQLDQENVMSGVDLHSKISSRNSGVFVSTKKDDVKLRAGSELQFAIAPSANSQS